MNDPGRTPLLQWSGVRRLPGLEGRIPGSGRCAIVLSTVGSLGDLYPVLSIARAIEMTGIEVRLALSPDDCEAARSWGLLAHPIGPTRAEVCSRLDVSEDQIAAAVLRDPGPMVRDVLIPMLPALVAQIRPLMDGASTVAATTFALHAPLAAEQASLPFVPLILQPMMLFSAQDPPRAGAFRLARQDPGRIGALWNRGLMAMARAELRRRHSEDLSATRARLGLGSQPGTPLLDHGAHVPLRLGLWDEEFAPRPADVPKDLKVVGFPPSPLGDLPHDVVRWIEAGPRPLVVTLGSIAQGLGGSGFWSDAAALARRMGLRAVLLHGKAEAPEGLDLLRLRYAAHGDLFPRAAAIIHHGGIGTSAEALRSGRPQLVVPVGGDQPDNAARLVRMGVAATMPVRQFTPERAHAALNGLLDRFDYRAAQDLGDRIAARNGAGQAALHLARVALTTTR
ncbi:nucleotide disphospho-sugar-binding domain-containing protein [Jannaschia aquimarina]|uniref:EryCIII protein n=1 Tax=Jannaschia aquimarina TaxID=935700 RepID=A0A0D1EHM4_9RHOB|nr:nucleotide disphospho-sugar-binding domain-containing protein [Jannaschia aquimarina]KIT17179.1 Desosaminyl transferase EryCIII precursor [Jannaschia aquimarina]SNT17899.1 UDP:flavonoid glycosyltransferase YjiC, YdhE family [Jannaschia aquimarina]